MCVCVSVCVCVCVRALIQFHPRESTVLGLFNSSQLRDLRKTNGVDEVNFST